MDAVEIATPLPLIDSAARWRSCSQVIDEKRAAADPIEKSDFGLTALVQTFAHLRKAASVGRFGGLQ
jgi:hypothetical protein